LSALDIKSRENIFAIYGIVLLIFVRCQVRSYCG